MVTESGKTLLSEIFFFLLSVDIGCAALLLRLYSFAAVSYTHLTLPTKLEV